MRSAKEEQMDPQDLFDTYEGEDDSNVTIDDVEDFDDLSECVACSVQPSLRNELGL
jgi:hypothetical protein